MMRRIALSAILFVALTAAKPVTRDEALANWLTAMGGRERVAAVRNVYREAKVASGGEEGTVKSWITRDGRFRTDSALAGFEESDVFDGNDGWTVPAQAPPHRVGPASRGSHITESYFDAYAQWFPSRRGGTIELESANDAEVVLSINPDGGSEAHIALDRKTWLPLRKQQRVGERISTTKYLSWETIAGVKFPKETLEQLGDPKYDTKVAFTKTAVNAPPDAAALRMPKRMIPVKYKTPARETTVPLDLVQNHIYFPISVNGHPPLWFIFDTGADFTAIEAGRAKELALTAKGAFEARGSGEASVDAGIIANPVITFGDIEIPLRATLTLPLTTLSLREGRSIDGIVGYEVISRFIVDIDYAKKTLHFIDPAKWKAPDDAVELPFVYAGNTPIARVPLTTRDGRTVVARLEVDCGSRGAVDLSRRFLDENHLVAPPSAIEGPLGAGIGGATQQRVGRLASIDLAGITIKDPVTSFSTATTGAQTSPDFDGLLGGEVLRRFTVTIDYPHERLLLRKNEHFDDPFEYDMSGLLLVAADAKYDRAIVKNVLPSSPAAEAGLAVNDEVVSVDGQPVSGMKLDELRVLFRIEGKTYVVRFKRGSSEREVAMKMRRLV